MSNPTNTDYSIFKEDPEALRVLLQNTVKKVVSDGWSDHSVAPRLKELLLNSCLTATVNKMIDTMWTEQNITNKVQAIQKVEKENPADFIAWRPTTADTIPERNLRGEDLSRQKQLLLNQLGQKTESKTKLKDILITKENSFNKCCTKLSDTSEYIINNLIPTKRDYRSNQK